MNLERWRYADGRLERDRALIYGIEAGPVHDSGRIAFGPDGDLYVATGRRRRRRARPGRRVAQRQVPAPDARAVPRRRGGRPGDLLRGPPQPAGLRLAGRPADLDRARAQRRRRAAGLRRDQLGAQGAQLRLAAGLRPRPRAVRAAAARLRGGDRAVGRHVRDQRRARTGPATTCSRRCAARRSTGCASRAAGSPARRSCSRASTGACGRSWRGPAATSTCSRATATAAARRTATTTGS